jgi:hypothetical protein
LTDFANLAQRADRDHLGDAGASHDQRTGKHNRQIIAARPVAFGLPLTPADRLANRDRLAGQQRLVGLEVMSFDENGVSRNSITLGKHDKIAAHNFAAGDTPSLTVADHQRTGAGQITQRFEHAFGACLLYYGDHDGQRCEAGAAAGRRRDLSGVGRCERGFDPHRLSGDERKPQPRAGRQE